MNRAFYIKRNGLFVPPVCRMNPAFLGSTVNRPVSGGGGVSGSPFIISGASGTAQPAFGGYVGFKFTSTGQTLDHLTWYVTSGNTAAHTVVVFDSGGGNILATVSVPTSGVTAGTYARAAIADLPTVNGSEYFVLGSDGGEQYTGDGTASVSTSAAGTISQSCYLLNAEVGTVTPHIVASGSKSFFGPSFESH